jgi:hypothetical protein
MLKEAHYFGKIHVSMMFISPVYISFNLLEMLQKFIHKPFTPIQQASALHDEDFVGETDAPQVHTSRMDIESSVPSEMQDLENNSSRIHKSEFADSSMGESDHRGRW